MIYPGASIVSNQPLIPATGSVRWFNDAKGYGILDTDAHALPVLVHWTSIQGEGFQTLAEGQRVEFVLIDDYKGPRAMSVIKVIGD